MATRTTSSFRQADSVGLEFVIHNDSGQTHTVQNDTPGTVLQLTTKTMSHFICDGTTWIDMGLIAAT